MIANLYYPTKSRQKAIPVERRLPDGAKKIGSADHKNLKARRLKKKQREEEK